MEVFTDPNALATLAILIGLELVLGIDNILLISILTSRLPVARQNSARILGLSLALGARILFLFGAGYLTKLVDPVLWKFSIKDLILIVGGAFLLFKAVKEIHHVVEYVKPAEGVANALAGVSFRAVIVQIILLDIVFSIDSVITAVGLTNHMIIIVTAVLLSFIVVLLFARPVAQFVETHPTLKILALSFLVTIGVTLVVEGLGAHVPKAYIYLPMGFALMVEFLQIRYMSNQKRGLHAKVGPPLN